MLTHFERKKEFVIYEEHCGEDTFEFFKDTSLPYREEAIMCLGGKNS